MNHMSLLMKKILQTSNPQFDVSAKASLHVRDDDRTIAQRRLQKKRARISSYRPLNPFRHEAIHASVTAIVRRPPAW
jgi:hypothetical protein